MKFGFIYTFFEKSVWPNKDKILSQKEDKTYRWNHRTF